MASSAPILTMIPGDDPDVGTTFEDLVRSHGFGLQTHLVTTEDGYILTLYRIINPTIFGSLRRPRLRPLLLQHGILETACDFVMSSPFLYSKHSSAPNATIIDPDVDDYLGDNLAFDLSLTKRYDVWVANSRGVMRTEPQHISLSTRDPRFWEFSFEELGRYDLPAVIDHILDRTNRSTLGYVGFSQGTTTMLALLTLRPEYGEKIQPFVALAPVSFLANMKTPLRLIAPLLVEFCLRDDQMLMSWQMFNSLMSRLCPYDLTNLLCPSMLFLVGGFDFAHLNTSRVPVYYSHLPSPVSNRQVCHFFKNYQSGRFARYDFGNPHLNRAHYGQRTAPDYPLERISPNVTIAFFVGRNDFFSNLADLETLRKELAKKSRVRILPNYVISEPKWQHLDFVIGTDAGNLVYRDVIDVLDRYTKPR